jgi:hypothetical protein
MSVAAEAAQCAFRRSGLSYATPFRGVHFQQLPLTRDSLECVLSGLAELDSRAVHEVSGRLGDQYLPGVGAAGDLRCGFHGDPLHVSVHSLDFTGVETGSDRKAEGSRLGHDPAGAADRPCREAGGRARRRPASDRPNVVTRWNRDIVEAFHRLTRSQVA